MDNIDDLTVKTRLTSPSVRKQTSTAALVRQYLPEIQMARRAGKTWREIGTDLNPTTPVQADTVRKSVERSAKRRNKARIDSTRPTPAAPSTTPPPQAELKLSTRNPFGHQVDPIRNN